ncbi:MAG: C_GCAxxG_C_C family protein [Deltaproteobacteria bacterium]|nr:C_GCAxxG_C_C family protein [Deltaproteobacteria bacterium]
MLTETDILERMMYMADNGYNCSQILMDLTLKQLGRNNPDLVRAMSGLGDGCGFFQETCGVMTSAACVISLFAGKGADDENEERYLLPMLQDLNDWFQEEIGAKYKGTRCRDIVGDLVGTPSGKQICGGVVLMAWAKVNELLQSYGYPRDTAQP